MQSKTVSHDTLKNLVNAGAVSSATVVGSGAGWSLVAQIGNNNKTLLSKSKKIREFKKFETIVKYLKNIGIVRFYTDAEMFDPDQKAMSVKRPDKAKVLKEAYAAVVHDKWFREQVQSAIDYADSENAEWLSHDEMKMKTHTRIAELRAR